MQTKRKRRLIGIASLVLALSVACTLVLYALSQNIDLYFTPSQLLKAHYGQRRTVRVGGWVERNSVHYLGKKLDVHFIITDRKAELPVDYHGVLPSLFREGQGVVVQGVVHHDVMEAGTVLAKHDANYHPPGLT